MIGDYVCDADGCHPVQDNADTPELRADPRRETLNGYSNIYVRARRGTHWDNVDIAELDHTSLLAWLRSNGGRNPMAEHTVALLLGHDAHESQENP